MQQAGQVAEQAEEEVEERVEGAEGALDPDCWWGLVGDRGGERGEGDGPAMGGKRTAMRARKRSELEPMVVGVR